MIQSIKQLVSIYFSIKVLYDLLLIAILSAFNQVKFERRA